MNIKDFYKDLTSDECELEKLFDELIELGFSVEELRKKELYFFNVFLNNIRRKGK